MVTFCDTLATNLLQDNNIFGANGFYFKDLYEFSTSGVSDRYSALFYIRHLFEGTGKFQVREGDILDQVTYRVRLVAQLPSSVDKYNALQSLLAQVAAYDQAEITSFSDDMDGIYKAEYGEETTIRDFYLVSIDFTVTETFTLNSLNCEPICIEIPN